MPRPSVARPSRAGQTIVAIATAAAPSGIGIVRLSGPDAISIGRRVFRSVPALGRPRRVEYGVALGEDGQVIDQALAWVFLNPRSYTGEDTVEISCHGSLAVLEGLVRASVRAGAVLAEPGEFTRRAFLNGKMDLVQAEAVADLIHAAGRFSLENAYGLLAGQLSRAVTEIQQGVLGALAQCEALLDFPDDVVLGSQTVRDAGQAALDHCEALTSTFSTFSRRQDGAVVAIVGPANAGKSSLFNLLLRESRSIVSPLPGTTRDLVEARLFVEGELFRLVDTAGLRESSDPVEAEGVARAHGVAASADIRIVVLDSSQPWDSGFGGLLQGLRAGRDILVLNKSDLAGKLTLPDLGVRPIAVSALSGEGVDLVLAAFRDRIPPAPKEVVGLLHLRHFECLSTAAAALKRALAHLEGRAVALECVAEELRGALVQTHVLLGTQVDDEVLDLVFSRFCIGK